ncbi:MAG: hypothetical protein OIF32_04410 [Campylobacterales bacterium]|nr:hypothetical protein [Campylobacterales bacterium]
MKIFKYVFFFFIISSQLFGENYVKEYTYNASENDSKASARKAALNALKQQLIKEVGTEVSSSISKTTNIKDDEYKKMIRTNLQTLSVALTKTEILDEKWDGEKFWIKVSIEVNKETMNKEFKKQIKKVKINRLNSQYEDLREKVKVGLYNLRTPEKIKAMTSKAILLPMEGEKNIKLHQKVLYTLKKYRIDDKQYRDFLFNILKTIEPQREDYRISLIIKYVASTKMYSEKESKIILDLLARMPRNMQGGYYYNMFKYVNGTKQELYKISDTYLQMVYDKKVGRPIAVDFGKEKKVFLRALPKDVATKLNGKWSGK